MRRYTFLSKGKEVSMTQPLLVTNLSIGNQKKFLSLISEKELAHLVEKHHADQQVTQLFSVKLLKLYLITFLNCSTLTLRQMCSMSHQLWLQALSGLGPIKRSALSKRNQRLPYQFFEDVFELLRSKVKAKVLDRNPLFKRAEKLKIFDSTFISLSLKLFPWLLNHCSGKGTFKIGLRIQDGFDVPDHVIVQTDSTNENAIFEQFIDLTKKAVTYIFDRGFYTISVLKRIMDSGNFFITRCHPQYAVTVLKKVTAKRYKRRPYTYIKEQRVLIGSGKNQLKKTLRLITVRIREHNKVMVFLTNRMDLTARQTADLYIRRWQIEPLFKWLKQALKINKFISCSLNGVMIQIYVAFIVQLLLILFKERSKKVFPSRKEVLREVNNAFFNMVCFWFFRVGLACAAGPPQKIATVSGLQRYVKERLKNGGH